jgi:PHP family Zn ribbon phosphoesterase
LQTFRADLHVHTVLSPCAEVELIPPLIVETALERGIHLIAITDHNSSANFPAVKKAALGTELFVLPGMELQTKEEVHSLCLFDSLEQINYFQDLVNKTLPDIKNQPEHFGEQFVVDETGEYIRSEERLLITSSSMSLNQAFELVTEMGGLFIPAHINRKAFGLIENLGFIPPDIPFPAVEVSRHITPAQARAKIPGIGSLPVIQNGDVHRLDEFLGTLTFHILEPSILEISMALKCQNERGFSVLEY